MSKKILIPIATGFEEIETITMVDILRRAGAEVVLARVESETIVTGRSNVSVVPDTSLDEALANQDYDLIYLPGGLPNAHILRDDKRIVDAAKGQISSDKFLAAICAAPLVLDKAGLLEDRKMTGHPTIKDELQSGRYCDERVVTSGKVITSAAAGTAMELAFTIVELLFGKAKVEEVNAGVLAKLS